MNEIYFEIINNLNENELEDYEKKLYIAYSNHDLVKKNHQIINNNRLRPNIPYNDLKIFIAKRNHNIIAAMTINTNTDNLQLVNNGFTKPEGKNFYEGLHLFMLEKNVNTFNILTDMFNEVVVPFLKQNNITIIYSTCSQELVGLYEMADWEVVSDIEMKEGRYLIKLVI